MANSFDFKEKEEYEFDLEGIDLPNHFLVTEEEGVYIKNEFSRYFIDVSFLNNDNLSLPDEEKETVLFLTKVQKKEIEQIFIDFQFYTN